MRTPLAKDLRSALERTVLAARQTAEAAARDVFVQLGLRDKAPPDWLAPDQKQLRRELRARARALGGELAADGTQETAALAEEVAYEQWHRMLFARFLAENGLLVYDGVPVSLADCSALADELGLGTGWDLAASCAEKMLPNVFRTDSLSFRVRFAPDKVKALEALAEGIAPATFQASDSLGWIYQYWQTRRKAEVNASEIKIGAAELAPVTQLFTEPYMVSFLLDNSLGAWYAAPKLAGRSFASEDEARGAVSSPGISLRYLRLVGEPGGEWKPAAGSFAGWPKSLSAFSMLDPACGSGHFAVAAFLMLVPMRMELEGLDARSAVDAVLSENIHALELDRRCVEIAAFAVALEAWRYPNAGGYRPLPKLNIACVGIAPTGKREDWLQLARRAARKQVGEGDVLIAEENNASLFEQNLVSAMGKMWDCFQQAPVLGSLISPDLFANDLWFQTDYKTLAGVLADNLAKTTDEEKEASIAAQGIIQAMQLLGRKYTLVATNVPYLARGKQCGQLTEFLDQHYLDSKWDLATAFIVRGYKFCSTQGTQAIVSPMNWCFAKRYQTFRHTLFDKHSLRLICRLGGGAFSNISGAVVKVTLAIIDFTSNSNNIHLIDAYDGDMEVKLNAALHRNIMETKKDTIKANSSCLIPFGELDLSSHPLKDFATCFQGLVTGDSTRFLRAFHEIKVGQVWHPYVNASGPDYGGNINCIRWENGCGQLHLYAKETRDHLHDMHESGSLAWGKPGVAIARISRYPYLYHGEKFDNSVAVITPINRGHLEAILTYAESEEFGNNLHLLDQKLSLTNATILQVPFDLERWQKVAEGKYPHGLPAPFTDDPTQWLFHGHPCGSVVWDETTKQLAIGENIVNATVLHVAVARLMGYKWPGELDPGMELAPEMRQVMARNAALEKFADNDGIVCIPALNGEESAAARLMALLAEAYGEAWSAAKLEALLESVGAGGKTLEDWLRKDFFLQHAKLFGNRPFVWQIWDGLRDGFSVLANYHKLDRKGLETLIYSYLGDWITRQSNDVQNGVEGAVEKLDRARELKAKLEKILEGEAPYDIFVRWKALKDQPVGWNPDLDDGVRLNIRPFCEAGVLRETAQKLNIKWGKDRGKDVPSAPWYAVFHGDRINDHHTTLAEKKAARGERQS